MENITILDSLTEVNRNVRETEDALRCMKNWKKAGYKIPDEEIEHVEAALVKAKDRRDAMENAYIKFSKSK